jgi:C-terminal binding protein
LAGYAQIIVASAPSQGGARKLAAQESPMSRRFTVLVADFLDETSIESGVLGDIADLVTAQAMEESGLADHLADADAILLFHDITMVGEATFSRAPRCLGVVRAGVGFNNIDTEAAARRGVVACNVPDYGTEEVADHAIMLMLAAARRLVSSKETIKSGTWDYRSALGTPRLRGKTFGVVGCGRIGTAAALRAKAFGLDVVFHDPLAPEGVDKSLGIRRVYQLSELLEQSHFVSLHCYLNSDTYHLIDAKTISQMRQGAIIINTARGPVIDELALLDGLDSGQLGFAALDVVEREPLDNERLRNHPSIIFTPHSAFYSVEGYVELRTKAAQEIRRILLGEAPRNPVNLHLLAKA